MKKALVNDLLSFELIADGDATLVNGIRLEPDLYEISANCYHLILNHQSFQIEIMEKDERTKTVLMLINGSEYRVSLQDEKDRLLERLGIEVNDIAAVKDLKAPMPGLVLDILVNAGDEVKKGDQLLVLEAMKMENLIKAPSVLTIKSVEVKKGDKIEKGQPLLYFE